MTVRLAALRGDISAPAAAAERLVAAYQNADAWSTLGTVRTALGERDSARQAFEEALAHRPRDPAILASLAKVWDE